ncbi:MAG TPA: pilus assembly protein N-terminal domain-containing protein [Bryobacteraceae bacterium]|nr:pilus assembly protein N-terminal domain-containing protein [Bryobacteraceae bacterium]
MTVHLQRIFPMMLLLAAALSRADSPPASGVPAQQPAGPRDLYVMAGKSVIIDSPVGIERVAVADGNVAEAVAATPREVLVNGRAPGQTSLVVWQRDGNRILFDLYVTENPWKREERLEAVRRELGKELGPEKVSVTVEDDNVYLRGTVENLDEAERAVKIASTLGKVINLLNVKVPPVEAQILLKVRFASVDRAVSHELGMNLFSTGALNTPGSVTTGAFSPPRVQSEGTVTLTDALNIFLFRPDLDLGATIKALEARRLLQILAEPNLLAINGKPASFLAGGEFPFPTLQGGGAGLGAVTIQFREFGVRITFLPRITPRNTLRIQVTPEVSSLDFANGLVFQGFTIPALATRRVQTEIELESGQTFAIGGLLDNRLTETLSKIPGLGDIPLLGKLFQARTLTKNNSELLVVVTPEIVRPVPAGMAPPDIQMPKEFLKEAPRAAPRTPGLEVTGEVPVKPPREAIPIETLQRSLEQLEAERPVAPTTPRVVELIPATVAPLPSPAPAAPPAAPPPQPAPPKP